MTSATTTLQAGVQASWELDLFGANRLASEAAQARLDSAQAASHDARVLVAAEVAGRYFDQRACEQQHRIAQAVREVEQALVALQSTGERAAGGGWTSAAASAPARP